MNNYIRELLIFIESIKIDKSLLSHEKCEIGDDKSKTITRSVISSSIPPKEYSFAVNQSAVFMLLDAFIDYKHPELMNLSFAAKYKKLPEDSACEKVIKGVFRILRILRNSLIHNIESVNFLDDRINMSTEKESLEMEKDAIKILNFIVWYSTKNDLSMYYNELVMINAYKNLTNIIKIKDIIETPMISPPMSVEFLSFSRYKVWGAEVKQFSDYISIQRVSFTADIPDIINKTICKNVIVGCSDYVINIGNKTYLISDECLTKSEDKKEGNILLNELSKFEKTEGVANLRNISPDYYAY